jgi:hypothetical protein
VCEHDLARGQRIFGDRKEAVAEIDLKAMFLRIVAHDPFSGGIRHPVAIAEVRRVASLSLPSRGISASIRVIFGEFLTHNLRHPLL